MAVTLIEPLPSLGPSLSPADIQGTGSLIIDEHSLPEADAAVIHRKDGSTEIQIQYFEEYLRFLELMCWCEEAIIGVLPIATHLPPEKITPDLLKACGRFGRHSGEADLRKKTVDRLKSEGVIKTKALAPDPDMLRADIYVRRLISASPSYRENFKPGLDLTRWTEEDERDLMWYTMHHGSACALTEFARRARALSHVPIVSHNVDIVSLDNLELDIKKSVVMQIADRLTVGARKEIEALEALGASVQLPPSPVSAQILREANNKHDLVTVALQIRSALAEVRQHINGLQREMMDENLPVEKRIRRAKDLQRVMTKLSPHDAIDVKKSIQSYSTFVENIKESVLDGGEFTIKHATDIIISKPIEAVIDRIRYRKYRILFDMKNKFLADKSYHKRVASVLGYKLSDPEVRISLQYCGHAVLNSFRHPGLR